MATVLAWPGAIIIGVSLGLFGSGGSVLTVPVLVYLLGQDEKTAIAGSLFIVGNIALAGSLRYLRANVVQWRSVLTFGVPGMIGTWTGAELSVFLSGAMQLTLFAIVMLVAAALILRPPALDTADRAERALWKIAIDGLVVGIITGLVGVGGGFLIVPALVLLGGLTMLQAIATSLVIIALKSYAGFIKYVDVLAEEGLLLDWSALLIVTALGIAGSQIGSFAAARLPQERLRQGFGVFLMIMAIYILLRSFI
jgi:uncharacterized membrane protein YfcA